MIVEQTFEVEIPELVISERHNLRTPEQNNIITA
jgi:hypothetical protein